MPIKKRLSESERLRKQLPKGWRATLSHPLMKKLCYGVDGFDPKPQNVIKAIKLTKGWKGAKYQEKLFVLCLDLLMEKAYGKGILDPDTYNRLQDHMESNQEKVKTESNTVWQIWCWDYYHDHYKLQNMEDGTLTLPSTVKVRKKKPAVKPKRRKLSRHK